ncbi:MAG TPA: CarD family transcriptional regulator [Anaerolineales bacterium]|jgi:RNA polymerase-interacting CarD/CdnL/TRCF family regulator|nr:CarD family transcriptional regulator [Anaerolineales bacterium]
MEVKDQVYAKGDWVVHLYHGVGQIIGLEKKCLEGKTVSYFKVKTKDSTYWVPVDHVDNIRLRPLATKKEIREAIRILEKEPHEMSEDHTERKSVINEVKEDGTFFSLARIVRDLAARQARTRLNDSEERALHQFTDRLVAEWSASFGIKYEDARQKLFHILQEIQV